MLVAGLMAVTACGGASDSTSDSGSSTDKGKTALSLVAYSTPQVVYDEIIPQFQKTGDGEGVGFKSSFGASGEQSRAVEAGLKADVVSFSTEPDMTRLVDAGLVGKDWNTTPNKGLVTTSVVSFIVRKGNPKNIKTWDDLLKPGVQVLTPNPFTSGAAKWNLLAGYGAKSDAGKNPKAGLDYLTRAASPSTSRSRTSRAARRCRPSPPAPATCCCPTSTRPPPPRRRARRSTT